MAITQQLPESNGGTSPNEERATLTVTCLAGFLFFNSFGSIGVALPTIQKQFGNSLADIQWITLMGVVTISSLSLCFGRAGGVFGQRRLYKIGVALYTVGSGLGGVAQTFFQLLSARAVMAVGLAMALPMSTAILASSFSSNRRGRVLGLFASAIAVGRTTGPTIGGILLQFGGWPSVFWMNFIVGLGVTLAVIKIFRGTGSRRRESFDIGGALTLLMGYPALLVGLTLGAKYGWKSAPVAVAFALAVAGLAVFIRVELRSSRPLVDLRLFKQRLFAAALGAAVLSQFIYNPLALCAPLYLQNVLGASALVAGVILAVLPLSTAFASVLSGRLADRYDPTVVGSVGLGLIVVGIVCYSRLNTESHLMSVSAVLAALGAGIGFFTPANQKTAFAAIGEENYGVLAAMLSSFGTAAGTLGTAITVALMEFHGGSDLWMQPAALAGGQQFAFACLAPVGLLALWIGSKRNTVEPMKRHPRM